jgi:hypothetical protein
MRKHCSGCCIGGAGKRRRRGHSIARICLAYEAGRGGFWATRRLQARAIEC